MCREVRVPRPCHFNSRPSARGDVSRSASPAALPFQFTPLREGRPSPDTTTGRDNHISIHAPPRGATARWCSGTPPPSDFNSRPSARGDDICWKFLKAHKISIHAPPRGATPGVWEEVDALLISIHAPPRGATGVAPLIFINVLISIHAPPRGATRTGRPLYALSPHFNSRPSARGDTAARFTLSAQKLISIHAPPRGATIHIVLADVFAFISIHAPPRGATKAFLDGGSVRLFQFTPLREGRRCRFACCFLAFCISIHAPPRGATRW